MRIANIWNLGVKELRGLVRDPALLDLIIFAFSVVIYTYSKAVPESLSKAAIAIVDKDRSPLSARLTSAFYPPYFLKPERITTDQMDARMDAGLDTFALDISPNFQRDLLAGKQPALQLNMDATRMSQAFTGAGHIQSIVSSEVSEFPDRHCSGDDLPVTLALRSRFNPELNPSWFGAIMSMIDNVTMLAIILTGAALIREREHGTVEHLLVMPVTPFEIMLSKVWSMGVVVLVASAVSLLAHRGQGTARRPHSGVDVAVSRRNRAGGLRHHRARHLSGHRRRVHAAIRHASGTGAAATADPVRRHDPARACRKSSSGSCWPRPTPISSFWPNRSCSAARSSPLSGRN